MLFESKRGAFGDEPTVGAGVGVGVGVGAGAGAGAKLFKLKSGISSSESRSLLIGPKCGAFGDEPTDGAGAGAEVGAPLSRPLHYFS